MMIFIYLKHCVWVLNLIFSYGKFWENFSSCFFTIPYFGLYVFQKRIFKNALFWTLFLVVTRTLVFEHGYSFFAISFVKRVNCYNLHISSHLLLLNYFISVRYIWYKVFKNGQSKNFEKLSPTNFTWSKTLHKDTKEKEVKQETLVGNVFMSLF